MRNGTRPSHLFGHSAAAAAAAADPVHFFSWVMYGVLFSLYASSFHAPHMLSSQQEVCTARSMRHEFVHYNYTNQDQQPDSLALDFEFKAS